MTLLTYMLSFYIDVAETSIWKQCTGKNADYQGKQGRHSALNYYSLQKLPL